MDGTSRAELRDVATEHVGDVADAMRALDLTAVQRIVARLDAARRRGATVFVAGNGGSAATASHWVTDLGKATHRVEGPRMRVVALADNTPWMTALANDEGYDRVFAEQLENLAREGDLLIVISCSGNSPNLLAAVECARIRGVESVALLGFDGGALRTMVDDHLLVVTERGAYELVEDVHSVVCHACVRALARAVSPAAAGAATA